MAVVRCPRCNGKGKVYNHFNGLGTFGIDYLFQAALGKQICPRCKGEGFLIIEE